MTEATTFTTARARTHGQRAVERQIARAAQLTSHAADLEALAQATIAPLAQQIAGLLRVAESHQAQAEAFEAAAGVAAAAHASGHGSRFRREAERFGRLAARSHRAARAASIAAQLAGIERTAARARSGRVITA